MSLQVEARTTVGKSSARSSGKQTRRCPLSLAPPEHAVPWIAELGTALLGAKPYCARLRRVQVPCSAILDLLAEMAVR